MTELQSEAIEAVEKINGELSERYKDNYDMLPVLTVTLANEMVFINFSPTDLPEFNIFSSIEDDRIWHEDSRESLYDFIKRKFAFMKEELNKINL